jgi:long-chain acyl-CoA synthetase
MSRDLILDRLAHHAATQAGAPALVHRSPDGTWLPVTWAEYHAKVQAFGAACVALGLPPGGVIGILGENRPEWVYASLGVMTARGVAAGIYQTSTPEQVAYILGHSEAMLLIIEDQATYARLAPALKDLPHLRRVVVMHGPAPADPRCQSFAHFLAAGAAAKEELQRRAAAIAPEDLACLIYTSGTTGDPKGVMLTHRNLAWTARCAVELIDRTSPEDCVVSYLPLSHIAEQMFTIYLPITGGYKVYFAGGIDRVKETLLLARPTIFLAVPRVWEKFKAALEVRLADARGLKAAIVSFARGVGMRAGHARLEHGAPMGLLRLEEALARRIFFSKLKGALGLDRVRLAISGAAPISRDVLDFFLSLEIPIMEVYGQSEDAGPTSFNVPRPGGARLGTVGRPLPGLEVKLAGDGEILVRGPSVFVGYYKDEQATAEALQDGWLHSGDVGEFDESGFLRITDRKKDLLKTSGGKYAAPQAIEKLLKGIPIVSQAVVIGDNRKYLTALLTLDPDKSRRWAEGRGLAADPAALSKDERCIAFVQERIDRINGGLARFETIKRFTLLPADFSVEGGELTPSQKVKRKAVAQRYAAEIEAMYQEG